MMYSVRTYDEKIHYVRAKNYVEAKKWFSTERHIQIKNGDFWEVVEIPLRR